MSAIWLKVFNLWDMVIITVKVHMISFKFQLFHYCLTLENSQFTFSSLCCFIVMIFEVLFFLIQYVFIIDLLFDGISSCIHVFFFWNGMLIITIHMIFNDVSSYGFFFILNLYNLILLRLTSCSIQNSYYIHHTRCVCVWERKKEWDRLVGKNNQWDRERHNELNWLWRCRGTRAPCTLTC